MKKIFSILLLIVINFNLSAQVCGTADPTPAQYAYTRDVVSNIMLTYNAGMTCVPIRPHIVRTTAGTGGISLADINIGISNLNQYYFDAGLEFYLCGTTPDYIDNDAYYNMSSSDEALLVAAGNEVTNAINMYFVNSLSSGVGSLNGYAYFPFDSVQSTTVLMRNGAMVAGNTILHEIGHHYSLYHTHQGTENGNNNAQSENVPRSGPNVNCSSRGDLLCGTHADPKYTSAGFNFATCTYIGGATDINGVTYTPDIDNIMNYFPDECQNPPVFTADQLLRMQQGNVVRGGHSAYTMNCPPSIVSDPSSLTSSFNGLSVNLSWTDNANNEMGYLIERSTISAATGFRAFKGFSTGVNGTSFSDNDVLQNTTYYYRVKAVNDNCNDYSNVTTVTTSTVLCSATGSDFSNSEYISNVNLGSINNTSIRTNYSNFTNFSTDLTIGVASTYTITAVNTLNPDTLAIWIDWNKDGDFDDANENITNTGGVSPYVGNITPPANAVSGNTIMRVRIHYNDESSNPCGSTIWGEVEDYGINVISTACNISALSAGTQTACVPATNTYTQEVIVNYTNAPATGTLDVNGQSFAITSSPQTVTLTNLTADGNAVNVTAVFSASAACTMTSNTLFTAPADCTPVVSNCGSETFDNSNLTSSYVNGSFVGDNSVTWTYIQSRDDANYQITGDGIMLRRLSSGSKVTSSLVAGGIGDFTCSLKKAFTGAGNRQVELFVNGISQGTSILWDNTTVQTFTVTGINITGNVIIEIRNNRSKQVIVDDISWTCYTAATGTPTITVGNNTMNGFTYQEGSGPSTDQANTLAWADLTGNVSSTNTVNYFEFSNNGGTTWLDATSLNVSIPPFPVTSVAPVNIDVRLKSTLVAGTYLDTIVLSSTGATTKLVYLSGIVTPAPLTSCSELFFSEYIEGSSNNKCIEIYNPTNATVDLAAGNYQIKRYNNGSTSATTYNLTGSITSGDVYVVCNNSATAAFTVNADITNSIAGWNGDDAIELVANGVIVDVIGQVGFDPGSAWNMAGVSTANRTLTRKTTIQVGDADGSNVFNPSLEWDSHPQDDASFLGSHTTACVSPTTFDWVGTTDTDWNTASNWSGNTVPSSTDVVTIPDVSGTSGNFPLITPSTTLGDITIANGAILTVVTGIVLDGLLTNNGSVVLQDGAYLDDFTNAGASFVGNITVETIAANGVGDDQRFISSPVDNPNISEIADDLNGPWGAGTPGINGVAVTVDDCNAPTLTSSSNYGNLFEYNETLVNTLSSCPLDGWVVRSSGSLENARGYSAYLTNNNTYDFTGTPNTGNITIATTNTLSAVLQAEGWNLLGNPYPSPIYRDSLISAGASDVSYFVTTGVYQGSYTSYGIGSSIAIAQGFQAHVNTSGNILFENNMRNTNAATWYSNDDWFTYKLDISVFGANYADKTTLFYNNIATNGYEPMYDVRKRNSESGHPTLSTFNSSKDLTLNGMSVSNLGETVPMNLSAGANGTFTLKFKGMETFPTNTTIYVKDLFTNTVHNIANGDYSFTANEIDAKERFELIFIPEVALVINGTDCDGNLGSLSLLNTNNIAFRTFELLQNNNLVVANDLTALNENLASGTYTLNIFDQYGGAQNYTIEIEQAETIDAEFNVSNQTVNVGEIVSFDNLTTNSTEISWVVNNEIFTNTNHLTYTFEQAGVYDIIQIVSNNNCTDNSMKTIIVSNKTTGIVDLKDNAIVVYPNPVKEVLYIDFTEDIKIEIVNMLGKNVITTTEKEVNMTTIDSGIYFVYIYNINNDLISINKIVKE